MEQAEYFKKLADMEQRRWKELEAMYSRLKAEMNELLEQRPYDYIIMFGEKRLTKMRGPGGAPTGSYSFTTLPETDLAVYRAKTKDRAERYMTYLEDYHGRPGQYRVVEVERIDERN